MSYLLIWDIDGTLIQGGGIGRKALNSALQELYGVTDGFNGINMAGALDAVIIKTAFDLHGIDARESSRFIERYCEILKAEVANLAFPIAAPGITALLEELDKRSSFYNVLGTGNIEKGARIKLSADDLNRHFPTGGFGDEALERWQMIGKAVYEAERLFGKKFDDSHIFVIGDTPKDIECGKKLSAKTIGVGTGPYDGTRLRSCGADYVFEDLSDTGSFLRIFA